MKVALIDNYDSFSYNLARYIREHEGIELMIFRNDEIVPDELEGFDRIVISPGPGLPRDSGRVPDIIKAFAGEKPLLGICLGLQAIYEHFGGTLYNLPEVRHGVASAVRLTGEDHLLFEGIPSGFEAGRYHSWVCDPATLPAGLVVTAVDDAGVIMACRHRRWPVHGVQFHPESFLTPYGSLIIRNFLSGDRVIG